MQSIKIENGCISSKPAMSTVAQYESTVVKIENVDDEQSDAEIYNSPETIKLKQENDDTEYDGSTEVDADDALFQPKFECEEMAIGIPTSESCASNSQKRHLQVNTDPKSKRSKLTFPEKCHHCWQVFGSYSDYKQHSRFHEANCSHRCHYEGCTQSFRTPNLLLRHISVRHYRAFRCNICDERFEFSKEYEFHRSTRHPKPLSCSVCEKSFAFKEDLDHHHITEHSSWKTESCKEDVVVEDDDDESETDASDQKESDLETEDYTESSGTDSEPYVNHHSSTQNEVSSFTCLIDGCDKIYKELNDRNKHMRRHLNILANSGVTKSYACKLCAIVFEEPLALRQHIFKHATEIHDVHRNICAICGHHSVTAQEHRLHTNRHKGLKPFRCSDCGQGFTTKYNRDRHERLDGCVSVEVVLCCVSCDEEFESALKLDQHKRMNLCPGKKKSG